MKNFVTALFLLTATTTTQASSLPDFPFVFAQGEATVEVEPDTATMTFQIKSFHESSSNAVAEVQRRSVDLVNFLGQQGFGKGTLVSYELDKSVVREQKDWNELNILGYEATRRFKLTIDDLSKYETVAGKLFKTDGVLNINTAFGRKDQERIEGDLLASACADARRNAESMAKGFGRELGDVHCITKFHFGNLGVTFGLGGDSYDRSSGAMYSVGAPDRDEFLFVPSTVPFQNSVSVIYKLKEI